MATAEEYAQWIVSNQDKKGTPEFETVAAAYKIAKETPQEKPVASVSGVVAEGAKGVFRGASQVGEMFNNLGTGMFAGPFAPIIRQLTERLSRPTTSRVQASPQNEADRAAGTVGEVVGNSAVSGGLGTVRNAVMTGLSAAGSAIGEQSGGDVGKATGAILPAVLDFALTAGRNVPKNMVARSTQKTLATDYANRGAEISRETKIPLSLGQQTGDEATMMVEGMAAKNPFSARKFQEFGANQVSASVQRLNKIMDDITPNKVSDVRMGTILGSAFDDAVNGAVKIRRSQAAADFDAVDAAAGNAKVIPTKNLTSTIDGLIQELDVPGGGDATASLVNRLKGMKDNLAGVVKTHYGKTEPQAKQVWAGWENGGFKTIAPDAPSLTANEASRLLEVYGKASAGTGQIFKDIDKAQQRMIASRLVKGVLSDLDEAVAGGQGNAAQLLKAARDNYRANSAAINKLEDSVIGKYLGAGDRSPERVADFLVKLKPTEVSQTVNMLNRANPELIPQTRRYFIERAIENAIIAPSKRNPSSPNFSAAKFIDAMPEGAKFNVIFGNSEARGELKAVGEALERIAYRGFTEGSPTAPLLMAWDAVKRVFTIRGMAGLPAAMIAPKTVAKASLTPEGRRALIVLGRYDKPTETTIRAASYLAGLASREQETGQLPTARTAGTATVP